MKQTKEQGKHCQSLAAQGVSDGEQICTHPWTHTPDGTVTHAFLGCRKRARGISLGLSGLGPSGHFLVLLMTTASLQTRDVYLGCPLL